MSFQFLREEPVRLARYLPRFLIEDAEFRDALENCSTEHERYRLVLQDVARQFFVETATWGLASWESELGLTVRSGVGFEDRRRNIRLKMQSRQTSTVSFMQRLASYFFPDGTKVEIQEQNEKSAFRVICDAFSADYPELIEAIEEYKPAHLSFALDYLMERETQIFATGYVAEYEVADILSGGEVSYQLDDLCLTAAGRVDGFEIIDIRSA